MLSVTSVGFPVFMAVLILVWYTVPHARRWQAVLAANLLFYLSLDAPGFAVLLLCTVLVWLSARRLEQGRGWYALGLAGALGPLLVLKYSGMVLSGLEGLWQPLGLSYFSLQLTGYLLDVRRKRIAAEPRFARLLCYAGFFLSITQGPFNHYDVLMPQLDRPSSYDGQRVWRGASRMVWGYFKKYAIADRAAIVVNEAFLHPERLDSSQLVFGVVVFALQLYADFSGYTDIVLGAGECLGLSLPENFRQPYLAQTIGEFWNRWHMSLSGWLNEYIFEPLAWSGWNIRLPVIGRKWSGQPVLTSLMLTFLVSGLWHGAAWNFVLWGALNGFYQVVSAWTRRGRKKFWKRVGLPAKHPVRRWWQRFVVFACVCFGYIFFRAPDLASARQYLVCMIRAPGFGVFSRYWELGLTSRLELVQLLSGLALLAAVDLLHERGLHLRTWVLERPALVRWCLYEIFLLAFLFLGYFLGGGAFLYARF